jgi:hypothetical protein
MTYVYRESIEIKDTCAMPDDGEKAETHYKLLTSSMLY